MTAQLDRQDIGPNPHVFVVGCPRSGTTLLRRLLNAHPELCIPKAETHWIPKFYQKGHGLDANRRVTKDFIDVLLDYPKFRKFGIGRTQLVELLGGSEAVDYPQFVARILDHYGKTRGKRLVGDKTPGYARHVPLLHQLFPAARFIHVIRDGRDVALSLLSWERLHRSAGRIAGFDADPVTTTALYWEWLVRLAREAGDDLPARLYLEIRYEDLVVDTASACRRMCQFLGLDYAPEMLEYYAGRQKTGSRLSAKKAWLPPTGNLRDWRSQLPAEDVIRFAAASGALLAELGYPAGADHVPERAAEHAARLRRAFERRPHPRAWQQLGDH